MTFEELKAEATRQGYVLSKKIVYERLKDCTCGSRFRVQELSINPKGKYYYCRNCGLKGGLANSWYEARQLWNKRVEKEQNDTVKAK